MNVMFVLLTGEDWDDVFTVALEAPNNAWAAPIFFIGFIILADCSLIYISLSRLIALCFIDV